MTITLFKCPICGNIVHSIKNSGQAITCCGQEMEPITIGMQDASREKHVPVVTVSGNTVHVKVGEVDHPMNEDHFIEWIAIETEKTSQLVRLTPGHIPEATFSLCKCDKFQAAYAYCNLHGLWKD